MRIAKLIINVKELQYYVQTKLTLILNMKSLQEVFSNIQDKKRELREINRHVKEALASSNEYQDVKSKMENLGKRKSQLKDSASAPYAEKMDLIKIDIEDLAQNLSDIALNNLMKGERVEIMDTEKGKFEPVFTVRFKKAS